MPSLIEKYADQINLAGPEVITSDILKAFALEIVQASLPERKELIEDNPMPQWGRDGFNACRSAVLDNAKKLINE